MEQQHRVVLNSSLYCNLFADDHMQPLFQILKTLPLIPSRTSSLNTAMRSSFHAFFLMALIESGKGDSPAVQPSPYKTISGFTLCNAFEIMFMVLRSGTPIRSNRNPAI